MTASIMLVGKVEGLRPVSTRNRKEDYPDTYMFVRENMLVVCHLNVQVVASDF